MRGTRLSDEVVAQLERQIAAGEWPVGTKIPPEPVLVAALGVGRNTVREAVRALEHAGLLEARRGDGTYVRATSDLGAALLRRARRTDALHVMAVRASLERDAAVVAATERTDADVAAIRAALDARRAAASDRAAFVAADVAFHRAVVAATHNPVLLDLYTGLTEALERTVAEVHAHDTPDDDPAAFPGHDELAEAIAAGDPDAARAAAERYLGAARAIVEGTR